MLRWRYMCSVPSDLSNILGTGVDNIGRWRASAYWKELQVLSLYNIASEALEHFGKYLVINNVTVAFI
jgi:hypothetical protein